MAKKVLVDLDFNGAARIIGLLDGVNPQDGATVAQLQAGIEGLAWKDSVRVSTVGNINLASPGATIDSITMATNDRVLVKEQTAAAENGIYIWNGAAVAMTRSLDANTADELEQAVVTVKEGTNVGSTFRQTVVNFILETDTVTFTNFGTSAPAASETTAGIAELATQAETDAGTDDLRIVTPLKLATYSGAKKKYAINIGDGAATQYTVTHNLNMADVMIIVKRVAAPYDQVITDIEQTSVNTCTIRFNAAPTSNQFRVVVIG